MKTFMTPADFRRAVKALSETEEESFVQLLKVLKLDPSEDLKGADLSEVDFSKQDLNLCEFINSDLSGSDFSDARFTSCIFVNASLSECTFDHAKFIDSDLQGLDFKNIFAAGVSMDNCRLNNAKLHLMALRVENISHSSIDNFELSSVEFFGLFKATRFTNNKMLECSFSNAEFRTCDFFDCSFSFCDFRESKFVSCHMAGLNLTGADFSGADLRGSDLSRSDLTGVSFFNTNVFNTTFWENPGLNKRELLDLKERGAHIPGLLKTA